MWPYWLAQFPLKDAGLYGKLIHYIQSCFLCQQIRYFISPFVFFQIDIKLPLLSKVAVFGASDLTRTGDLLITSAH